MKTIEGKLANRIIELEAEVRVLSTKLEQTTPTFLTKRLEALLQENLGIKKLNLEMKELKMGTYMPTWFERLCVPGSTIKRLQEKVKRLEKENLKLRKQENETLTINSLVELKALERYFPNAEEETQA